MGMAMDPGLWGALQQHISLPECVYLKLPLREFFRLRGVCKEWNRLALERRCVTDPLRKPYITMVRKSDAMSESHSDKHSLHGMLTFDVATNPLARWRWTPHPEAYTTKPFHVLCKAFSAKTLLFDLRGPDDDTTTTPNPTPTPRIYDAHTQRAHLIPQPPGRCPRAALGIAVDNSVMPHTFQLVLGSAGAPTQLYDSASSAWTTKPSSLSPDARPHASSPSLHCDDCVYIWSQVDQILVYSFKNDLWTILSPSSPFPSPLDGADLASWKGRVFTVMDDNCITTFVG